MIDGQLKHRQGSLSEYFVVPSTSIVTRPANLKPTEAAGMAMVSLTEYHALFNIAKLQPGQINGGGTSVGMVAIQLAESLGCNVAASASTSKEELLRSLGVDAFIDYERAPVHKQLKQNPPSFKFDVFVEAVGTTDANLYSQTEYYISGELPFTDFTTYSQFVDEGKVKPVVESVYAFEDVHKAYERLLSQRTAGKVVVKKLEAGVFHSYEKFQDLK
ncbi:hypothetical protein BC835DRAFT_1418746 [Cytidiella melzeri]|nr:hypothetical protein BC835DRAFT_1418746 [Cytidiella melzeri]